MNFVSTFPCRSDDKSFVNKMILIWKSTATAKLDGLYLVSSNFQLDVRNFDLRFQFYKVSYLQNSTLEFLALLIMNGIQERSFGPYSKKLV